MLALAPLNTAALNSAAVVLEVQFAATGGVSASAVLDLRRVRGFRAAATAAATAQATTFGRSLRSTTSAIVSASPVRASAIRGFSAAASVSVVGSASLPGVVDFASAVTVGVTGLALLGGKLLESGVAVSAQATAAPTRWRIVGSSTTAQATQTSALARVAGFSSAVPASATATPADVDVIRAGVRVVGFSAFPRADVLAQLALVRVARFSAQPAVGATAQAAPVRRRSLLADASVSTGSTAQISVRRPDGSEAFVVVTAQATLRRVAGLRAAASAQVLTNAPQLVLAPAALRSGARADTTAVLSAFDRRRGMWSQVAVSTESAAELTARKPTLLASLVAVSAAVSAQISVAREWSGTGAVVVTGIGDLRTNIFDDEPDYRSFVVPRQEFAFSVPRQEFTAYISSDVQPMITFTKQPAERLAYDFEFLEWFADLQGDDIEAASVEVISASAGTVNDLVVEQPLRINSPSTRVKIWIEGGANGAKYKLTLTVDTEGGRRKTVDFYLRVKEL